MKSGETAGPDEIPIDIYKTFKDKLMIPLNVKSLYSRAAFPLLLEMHL